MFAGQNAHIGDARVENVPGMHTLQLPQPEDEYVPETGTRMGAKANVKTCSALAVVRATSTKVAACAGKTKGHTAVLVEVS